MAFAVENHGSKTWRRSRFSIGIACASLIGLGAYYSTSTHTFLQKDEPDVSLIQEAGTQPVRSESTYTSSKLGVSNKYGEQTQSVQAGFYTWGQVVEPYKATSLSLKDSSAPDELQWTIVMLSLSEDEKEMASLAPGIDADFNALQFPAEDIMIHSETTKSSALGHEISYEFTKAGRFYLVTIADSSGNTFWTEKVICKYVRRELRNLDDEDREEYLNAIHEVMVNSQESGEEKYGKNFLTGNFITSWHLGSNSFNSPYHSKPSFFTAHAFLASMFETSMQSVEPATALHYWDYTIDAEIYNNQGKWTDSFFWTGDWFGPVASDDKNDTEKRALGRWSDVPVIFNRESATHNSYGLVTEPFNNNPSRYLTRSFSICGLGVGEVSLPDCNVLKGTFAHSNMHGFHNAVDDNLHFELHPILGGSWECGADIKEAMGHSETLSTFLTEMTTIAVESLATIWKSNYYKGYLTCPDSCSLDTAYEDCQCVDENLAAFFEKEDTGTQDDEAVYSLFEKRVLTQLLENDQLARSKALLEFDDSTNKYVMKSRNFATSAKFYRHWLKLVARGGKLSQFSSPLGSANDPIFWPIHVAYDKIWHFRRVSSSFSNSWTPDHSSNVTGWGYLDPLAPMSDAYGIVRASGTYFTNQEIVQLFNPSLIQLPYIYDDYKFSHCD